ncbi:hypothetical protein KI809_09395 [Geobacter pelophilus]|uniref:Uncharacterized protein n=1 Tax=Geoanaerobacter pelophilus TaxID=60036 RepID=A0AAW4L0X7_9BACT|nr:hypothetical protein [Geoanaerobacter pelophilus]MBT0664513.1 hypothetical protein [Geoanaerobacter pelophilus]
MKAAEKGGGVVPKIGFHDIYGVWFSGLFKEIIITIGKERFGIDLGNMMHVYVDVAKTIADGVHDITVYGHECRLYKWLAQGYHRGLVVLKDDVRGNQAAEVYLESRTCSWMLSDEYKAKLL